MKKFDLEKTIIDSVIDTAEDKDQKRMTSQVAILRANGFNIDHYDTISEKNKVRIILTDGYGSTCTVKGDARFPLP